MLQHSRRGQAPRSLQPASLRAATARPAGQPGRYRPGSASAAGQPRRTEVLLRCQLHAIPTRGPRIPELADLHEATRTDGEGISRGIGVPRAWPVRDVPAQSLTVAMAERARSHHGGSCQVDAHDPVAGGRDSTAMACSRWAAVDAHASVAYPASMITGAPRILLGQAPRDRRRWHLPASALSRCVPARLTCQAAGNAPAPPFGRIPGGAKGPFLTRKGP